MMIQANITEDKAKIQLAECDWTERMDVEEA